MRYSRFELRILAWKVLLLRRTDEYQYNIRMSMFAAASGYSVAECWEYIVRLTND